MAMDDRNEYMQMRNEDNNRWDILKNKLNDIMTMLDNLQSHNIITRNDKI
jgi:hypothetical protein